MVPHHKKKKTKEQISLRQADEVIRAITLPHIVSQMALFFSNHQVKKVS
jgi:uncharacterized protein (DUF1800 family)